MDERPKLLANGLKPEGALEISTAPPGYPGALQLPQEPQHLYDYLIVLRKHQWLILTFLLAVVTIVTIGTFKMRPVYQAVARIQIDTETQNTFPFQSSASWDVYVDMENYIETQAKNLQSETLALDTIRVLHLDTHPEFGAPPRKNTPAAAPGGPVSATQQAIMGAFLTRLSVSRVRNSRLLEVKFEAHDPELAARVVNAHLANFIERNYRTRYESTTQASNWLAGQLEELKIKVEKSEDARLAYERANEIWTIDEKQNITTQKLSDLNRELTAAQADRMQKQSNYQLIQMGSADSTPAVRESPIAQDLLRKKADLRSQYTEALNQFGPNYPKVTRLVKQIEEIEQTLKTEKQNVVGRVESEYRGSLARERLLAAALEKQKTEANALAQKLVQYNILKREAETNKQLYEGLLQKLKEAGISAGLRSSNIRVVDPALVPPGPARPQKARNILMAVLAGLIGGVCLAFLREYMDNTVKTPEDVEFLTHLPSLAVVPQFAEPNGRRRLGRRVPKLLGSGEQQQDGNKPAVELIAHERPQSQISEAFRSLRTSLLLAQAERPPQVILVTSGLPGEGKTTAALNLAVTLAQLGDRTLLIDADLRKPGIRRALGFSKDNARGLSSYLAGACSLNDVTFVHPRIANLAVIPSGPIPPNPAELLSAERLRESLVSLRQGYKFVILDSPPVLSTTDGVILSVVADGVLLVVRSARTPKEALRSTRGLLGRVKCRVLGVLLNAVDFESPQYYYSYRYYSYGYYTYGAEKQTRA